METETQLAFAGTDEEKNMAAHAFEVMKRKGILFGANAPIRMSAEGIAKALVKAGGPMAGGNAEALIPKIEASLSRNPEVFARSANGEFVTTKAGRAYHEGGGDREHTFKQRLNTQATALDAEAAKEYAESLANKAAARAERSSIAETVTDTPPMQMAPLYTHAPQITFDNTTVIPQHLYPQPPAPEPVKEAPRPAAASAAPAAPAAPPVAPPAEAPRPAATTAVPVPAAPAPARPKPGGEVAPAPETAEVEAPAEAVAPAQPAHEVAETGAAAPAPAPVAPAQQPAPAQAAPASAATTAQAPAAPAPAPAPVEPPRPAPAPVPVVTGPIEVNVVTEDGPVTIDLNQDVEDILANDAVAAALKAMITQAVEEEGRIVTFGSDLFPEDAVERFSKGDFRRIKEFLDEPETGGVASDTDFMDYVLNRRSDFPDYERLRFSLNYRLLKEKKDFEFVGIDTNRLWMNAGAVPVASPKRKPAEIGQDYRYLEDPAIASVEAERLASTFEIGPIEHSLTYYEYENGVLPYDYIFKQFIPGPVLEDQRAALLQFEIPQLYVSVLAELRYPTGNRGGYIMGLADFFAEHMVPGAKVTILPTDRADNIFELHYTPLKQEVEENLLQYDDRKGRYVFRPVTYSVTADPSMLLTQEKFAGLQNRKRLEESERKRPDVILSTAFEELGEQTDGKYWAIVDDLYPVVNLDRPVSRIWLETLLSGAYPFFYSDETTQGAYFYDPSKRPA